MLLQRRQMDRLAAPAYTALPEITTCWHFHYEPLMTGAHICRPDDNTIHDAYWLNSPSSAMPPHLRHAMLLRSPYDRLQACAIFVGTLPTRSLLISARADARWILSPHNKAFSRPAFSVFQVMMAILELVLTRCWKSSAYFSGRRR